MNPPNNPTIQRALLSVSDKTGITDLAKALHEKNIEILSTGGTAALLQKEGIPVTEVSDYTGFPEMMGGRLKTLHPKIHGGLLGRRGTDDAIMQSTDIPPIDLVVVNLYPFEETIAKEDCTLETAIEQIDIGGPTMLRSAAKNYASVAVVVEPEDYPNILEEINKNAGKTSLETRFTLAQKVFSHTAKYEGAIANYLTQHHVDGTKENFPQTYNLQFIKKQDLRYGENPHQKAAFYVERQPKEASVAISQQHQGKPLSYNNIADTNAALECVKSFNDLPACVIVKHANPCGVATGKTQLEAYERAYLTDTTSAFGGIIAFNQTVTTETIHAILDKQFLEVLIAPAIENQALTLLAKKPNIRVLTCGNITPPQPSIDYHRINGGMLVQDQDSTTISPNDLKIVTKRQPTVQEFNDLLFAWEVAKFVKSNAIVYAKNRATIGVGAGQMSRVFSAIIAGLKAKEAGLEVKGSVMASDAFFPFRDGIDTAAKVGIAAIIQPGGSMRDAEVIEAADEAGMAMIFTGMRHFKH